MRDRFGRRAARSPWLSLFGAYVALEGAASPKPLVVDLYGLTAPSSLLRGVATFRARVHAEDLVATAEGSASVVRRDGGTELRVTFADRSGAPKDIVVRGHRGRSLALSLTELSGQVLGGEGTVVATARLRLNWRGRR